MPDPALHGNGDDCPACALRREAAREDGLLDTGHAIPCNFCGGTGRVGRDAAVIVLATVLWAARHYWPAAEARWRAANDRQERP